MLKEVFTSVMDSPLGPLWISATDQLVVEVSFTPNCTNSTLGNSLTEMAKAELSAYFEGYLRQFTFPFQQSGTDFQLNVWHQLTHIPYGTTLSYAAFSAFHPKAIRAVAAANGKNKMAIVVPCHRVIGSNGTLVGYAGGLERKRWLLNHESSIAGMGQSSLPF